jgi:hypothetical protein
MLLSQNLVVPAAFPAPGGAATMVDPIVALHYA